MFNLFFSPFRIGLTCPFVFLSVVGEAHGSLISWITGYLRYRSQMGHCTTSSLRILNDPPYLTTFSLNFECCTCSPVKSGRNPNNVGKGRRIQVVCTPGALRWKWICTFTWNPRLVLLNTLVCSRMDQNKFKIYQDKVDIPPNIFVVSMHGKVMLWSRDPPRKFRNMCTALEN